MSFKRVAVGLTLSVLVVCAIEGAASLFLFAWDVAFNAEPPLAERAHTMHDPDLGWVNAKSVRAKDVYGPGRDLSTNSRGFRGEREIADAVPAGKVRVICSGDSFTLGYGVGDAESWPAQLESLDPRIEAVNMAQGGYGIDQAYLWFARDAAQLEHQVHVFAFIADDFERMRSSRFRGYAKPVLWHSSPPTPAGVPVPIESYSNPWLTQNAARLLDLRTISFARRALNAEPSAPDDFMDEVEAHAVAGDIFAELARLNLAKKSRLVLVFLPTKDHAAPGRLTRLSGWMQRAVDEARDAGTPFIDLTDDFERRFDGSREELFIQPGEIALPGAAGHYSSIGNRFVAERLHASLVESGALTRKD